MTAPHSLAVFDFDSTLMDGETIDTLAAAYGVGDEVVALTRAAMGGTLDFFGALQRRVALLRDMPVTQVEAACASMRLMPGAREVVHGLKTMGYRVVVFSGGFTAATGLFQNQIGYDTHFANQLHAQDGKLTGLVGGSMMFQDSKGTMLERLQQLMGISRERTLVCGDGANDLSMFAHADTRIAFGPKGVLDPHATAVIKEHDLRGVLDVAAAFSRAA